MFKRLKDHYPLNSDIYHLITISVIIALTYIRVTGFDFMIGWDDQWFVLNEYTETGFTLDNLYAILTDFYYGQYAPLNQLYYTSLYSLIKFEPSYYHLLNIVIHALNSILVYFLSKRLAGRLIGFDADRNVKIAFFTAILFAVLPINLEPVAWVAASKVGLYAFFYLLAIHSYCRFLELGSPKYYYLTILLFIISFGAKEQSIVLPVCLILLDYVYRREFTRLVWYEKFPFFILSILFGLITLQCQEVYYNRHQDFYPLHERIVIASYTLIEYFTKTVIPINLSYLYPFPYLPGEKIPLWLMFYFGTFVLTISLLYRKINRRVIFGVTFFLIHIILVSNFTPLGRFSIVADRYAYVSTIGLCFIFGCLITNPSNHRTRNLSYAIGFSYIAILSIYTFTHSSVWKNADTLKARLKYEIRSRSDFPKLQTKIK